MFKRFVHYYHNHKLILTLDMIAAFLIAVISRGKIIEMGNHEDLMKLNGTYADLFRLQFKNSDQVIADIEIG